jgi:hypothetical protein
MSIMAAVMAARLAAGEVQPIKDREGNAVAVIVTCDTCQAGTDKAGKACAVGAEKGWFNGLPCGECLLRANAQEPLGYPYDLHIMGKLADGSGTPVKERFVRLFFPNGWTMRARTSDDGSFHLMLGATAEKKSTQPLLTDLGTFVDKGKGSNYFALFILPESYKPCPAQSAAPAADKSPKKQTKKR